MANGMKSGEPLIRIDSDGVLVYASAIVDEGPLGRHEYRVTASAVDDNRRPRAVDEVNKELEGKIRDKRKLLHTLYERRMAGLGQ